MDVLEDVITWLAAGDVADYRAGVLLLQEHCKNRSLVNNLLKKESDANRQKLFYELVKVLCGGRMEEVSEVMNHFAQAVQGALPPVQQVADVLVEAHRPQLSDGFAQQPEPEQVPEQLRPQVDDLTQLMSRVYNQRCQLSNSLATLDPADGPRVVGEILALEQQYNALALKRKNVVEAGQQPVAPTEASLEQTAPEPAPAAQPAPEQPAPGSEPAAPGIDRAELLQQRSNLRSQLSKNRGKVTSAKTVEKRVEYEERAAKIQAELTQIELTLKCPSA